MKVDLDDLITQKEAARIRGVSVQAINDLVRRGRLKTATVGGRKFVLRSEVKKFKARAAGRPKGKTAKKRKGRQGARQA